MKSEKEIKEFLTKTEHAYTDAVKCKQKYLTIVGSSAINALRYVLEMEPYNFNRMYKREEAECSQKEKSRC